MVVLVSSVVTRILVTSESGDPERVNPKSFGIFLLSSHPETPFG